MKKRRKILSLMLALLLTLSTLLGNNSVLNVKAEAGATEILKGTPLFDGQLDDMYKESLTLSTGTGDNAFASEGVVWAGDHGNIHFLYDDTYLYICADIKDDSVCSRGDIYVAGYNPNQNDNCEFRLCLNSGIEGVAPTGIKVGVDAYGIRVYGLTADEAATDYSKIQYKTTIHDTNANSGYVIEVAIPHTDGGILNLLTAGKLGFKLQLNDLDYDGAYRYFATDYAGEGPKGLVYYELSQDMVTGGDVNTPPTMIEDKVEVTDYLELSIADSNSCYAPGAGSDYTYAVNEETGILDISYGVGSGWFKQRDWWYIGRLSFKTQGVYSAEYPYVRVLYAADLPTGAESVQMAVYDYVGDTHDKTDDVYIANDKFIIEPSVKDTNGEFVLSPALKMTDDLTGKLAVGGTKANCAYLMFSAAEGQNDGKYQIKSLYFFKTEKEANNFVIPSDNQKADYQKLSFADPSGYYKPSDGSGYGNSVVNMELGTIDITYGNVGSWYQGQGYWYMGKVGFPSDGIYNGDYKFMRVLYSASNLGEDGVKMTLSNDASGGSVRDFSEPVKNTNGEFVLSSTLEMTTDMIERYKSGRKHMSLCFSTEQQDANFKIKAFYFFKTKEEADAYTPTSELIEIKINGNDISDYKVVVPVNGIGNELASAQSIVNKIQELSGVKIPIVYDSEAVTDYEILIGDTNRVESSAHFDVGGQFHPSYEKFSVAPYRIERRGNKLVLVAATSLCVEQNTELFSCILNRGAESGEGVDITTDGVVARGMYTFSPVTWPEVTNVAEPKQFVDSFETDEGYWTNDSEKQGWTIADDSENKVFSTGNSTTALSYLHVYEKNVSFETKLKAAATQSGQVGLLLRHTADHAYIKAGYDFATKEWFIDVREGEDFMLYRLAAKTAEFTADQWYNIKAVVDGETATLYVNGEEMVRTDDLVQHTPGKIGVFADSVSAMVDDVSISLLSGQGTFWKNAVHYKLPGESYREGGIVVEMTDGSLVYQSRSYDDATFTSTDSGKTWVQADEMWSDAKGYPTVLRLKSGELLRLGYATVDGAKWEQVTRSTDDGAPWQVVGEICPTQYQDNVSGGHHVNGLTQMSDGRIFFVMSYEASGSTRVNGCKTFCEIYYSDDKGETWTKSTMATFDIEGNQVSETHTLGTRFAEAKILETAEDKLRIYCSHNDYGYMVYSESEDNGVTWEPLQIMTDFPCATTSMNFVKDTYADNETTYYMVWVKNSKEIVTGASSYPRSHLAVVKSTDGINWVELGEAWRWECHYSNGTSNLQQIVDPFIEVTKDYLFVGSGISEKAETEKSHQAQRQHIWSVAKSTLEENTWKSDDTSHWQESTAGVKVNEAVHTSAGDNVATCTKKAVCDVCEAEYGEEAHSYDTTTWKSDANGHWYECSCQAKTDEAAHTPGAAATATTAQTCTECGYVIAPATGETDSDSDTTDSDTTDSDSNDSDTSDSTDSDKDTDTGSDTQTPEIVESATDDSYTLGSNAEVTIKATGEFSKFESVEMDGEIVDESNYSVKEGSTIVTFKTAYLETLSEGDHTVTINYNDGSSADAKLAIIKTADTDSDTDSSTNEDDKSDSADTNVTEDGDISSDDNTTAIDTLKGAVSASSTSTGDNSNVFLWIILAAGAIIVAVLVLLTRKKNLN